MDQKSGVVSVEKMEENVCAVLRLPTKLHTQLLRKGLSQTIVLSHFGITVISVCQVSSSTWSQLKSVQHTLRVGSNDENSACQNLLLSSSFSISLKNLRLIDSAVGG